jgi:DNA-binding IclR family transcriptional regulator
VRTGTEKTVSRGVESVARAVDLLEALSEEDDGVGLVELGRRTGLHPSTTHRLLATLTASGYVRRDPESGLYALGYGTLKLSAIVERRSCRLREAMRPYLRRIHAVSGQTINLYGMAGAHIVLLDQILDNELNSAMASRSSSRELPAHATAAGRVIFAFTAPVEVEKKLNTTYLTSFTRRTLTNPRNLLERCDEARGQGWAVCREELVDSISCVAAPVFDRTGTAIAAMCVSGPTRRLQRVAAAEEIGELIGRAGIEASREIGYVGQSPW